MKQRRIPQRMCVSCREMKPRGELARVVRTPDGEFVLDETGKRAGRGAYICKSPDCVAAARKQRKIERSLGGQTNDISDLYDRLV